MDVCDVDSLGLEVTPQVQLETTDSDELEALLPLELKYVAKAFALGVQNMKFHPAADGATPRLNAMRQRFTSDGVQSKLPVGTLRRCFRLRLGMEDCTPIHVANAEGAIGGVDWNHEHALALLWNDEVRAKPISKLFSLTGAR